MNDSLATASALAFVREQGVVLASAKGDAPRLVEAILGEPIRGNWWTHPRARFIFNVLSEVSASSEVLVCRLLHGKVTLIHRRLWPALVRVASRLEPAHLAQVRDRHMPNGRHVLETVAFPGWVPAAVHEGSTRLGEHEALVALGPAVAAIVSRKKPVARRSRRASAP